MINRRVTSIQDKIQREWNYAQRRHREAFELTADAQQQELRRQKREAEANQA